MREHGTKTLSAELAGARAWTNYPGIFVADIKRLVEKDKGKKCQQQDLLDFLDTIEERLNMFMEEKLPEIVWITKLARSAQGVKILHKQNILSAEKDLHICTPFGMRKLETGGVLKVPSSSPSAKSAPSPPVAAPQPQKRLDEAEIKDYLDWLGDVMLSLTTEEAIANLVAKRQQDKVASQMVAPEPRNNGKTVSWPKLTNSCQDKNPVVKTNQPPTTVQTTSQADLVPKPEDSEAGLETEKTEEKTMNMLIPISELVIPFKYRRSFLNGFQKTIGYTSGRAFNQLVPQALQDNFSKNHGRIYPHWVELIQGKGAVGEEFLLSYRDLAVEVIPSDEVVTAPTPSVEPRPKKVKPPHLPPPPKITRGVYSEHQLMPKKRVKPFLAKLKGDSKKEEPELAFVLAISPGALRSAVLGEGYRLHLTQAVYLLVYHRLSVLEYFGEYNLTIPQKYLQKISFKDSDSIQPEKTEIVIESRGDEDNVNDDKVNKGEIDMPDTKQDEKVLAPPARIIRPQNLQRITTGGKGECVERAYNNDLIKTLITVLKLKTEKALADLMGFNSAMISLMKRGTAKGGVNLYLHHIDAIVKKREDLDVEDFYVKIGLKAAPTPVDKAAAEQSQVEEPVAPDNVVEPGEKCLDEVSQNEATSEVASSEPVLVGKRAERDYAFLNYFENLLKQTQTCIEKVTDTVQPSEAASDQPVEELPAQEMNLFAHEARKAQHAVHRALLQTGACAKDFQREYFIGCLAKELPDYCLQVQTEESMIIITKDKRQSVLCYNHLPFAKKVLASAE